MSKVYLIKLRFRVEIEGDRFEKSAHGDVTVETVENTIITQTPYCYYWWWLY